VEDRGGTFISGLLTGIRGAGQKIGKFLGQLGIPGDARGAVTDSELNSR